MTGDSGTDSENGRGDGKPYAISNLLPPRAIRPLAVVAKAVLIHIHEPLPALLRQRSQRRRAIAQLLERAGAVAVDHDISLLQQLVKDLAARRGLQVEVRAVLAHVDVELEERHVGEVRRCNLQHVRAVLGEDAPNHWAGDDAAQLEDFDASEHAGFSARYVLREGHRGGGGLERCDGPGGEGDVVFPVRSGDEVFVFKRCDAGLAEGLVLRLELVDGELLDVRLDALGDVLDGLEVRPVGRESDHVKCCVGLERAVDVEVGVGRRGRVEVG